MARIRIVIERELADKYIPEFLVDPKEYVDSDLFMFLDHETTTLISAEKVEN